MFKRIQNHMKTFGKLLVGLACISALAALLLLLAIQFVPELGHGTITIDGDDFGGFSTAYNHGALHALVTWLGLSLAFVVVTLAIAFAIGMVVACLAFVALMLGLVALLLASPLLLLVGAVLLLSWAVKSFQTRKPANAAQTARGSATVGT